MMSVIPQADHGPGEVVFISQCAQTGGAQHERPRVCRRFDTNPAGGQYPNEVSAGEKQHVTLHRAHAAYYAVRPSCRLLWRLTPRATVAEKLPVRAIRANLGRGETLILAIVPLDQIMIDFGSRRKPRSSQVRTARCKGLVNT